MAINQVTIRRKFDSALKAKKFEAFARNAANTRFVAAKLDMIRDIDKNEVIQEIKAACKNPALDINDIVSVGNLASVIGFHKDSHPEEDLKEVLNEEIKMNPNAKITLTRDKVNYTFRVSLPSKGALDNKLPVPDNWVTKSWVRVIEEGISASLIKYVFHKSGFSSSANSRSTTGLQLSDGQGVAKNRATFTPKKFLTEILEKFINKFK